MRIYCRHAISALFLILIVRTHGEVRVIRECRSSTELFEALRAEKFTLPLRSEGRNKAHIERWVLCRLLAALAEQGELKFPIFARDRERPDFDINIAESKIGLEITEALLANYAQHQVIQEREFPDSFIDPGHFRRGPVPLKNQREILSQKQLTAPPYMGDSIEREWAEGIARAVESKLCKLRNSEFEKRPVNWLAIKDSLPIHTDWISKGLLYLRPLISSCWSHFPAFDQVFIDHGDTTIVALTASSKKMLLIPKLWAD